MSNYTFNGAKLKMLLEQRNKEQKDLAEAVGVSEASVSNWCKGYKIPSLPVAARVAEYLGVTVNDLIIRNTVAG